MFQEPWLLSLLAIATLMLSAVTAEEVALDKIDRSVLREPIWKSGSPQYCLFVMSATQRIWFIVDGDDLYMDINSNGDLTEPNDKLPRLEMSFQERKKARNHSHWLIPDIQGPDGRPIVSNIRIQSDKNRGASIGSKFVYIDLPDRPEVFLRPAFSDAAKDAPMIHPTGPVRLHAKTQSFRVVQTSADGVKTSRSAFHVIGECYVEGLGVGTSFLVPTPDLHCKMEFPLSDGTTAVEEMRLSYYTDWGSNRSNSIKLPLDVADGTVKITVSVPPVDLKTVPEPFVFEKATKEKVSGTKKLQRGF